MKTRLFILSLFVSANCLAQRTETYISEWQFSRDSMSWETVTVPHDWAISGPFDKKWDLQKVAITQNGETEATEKSGRSGALPWIGKGWYRTEVTIPDGYEHAELLFDGAMSEPQVYINGKAAGYWAYGYNAFRVDATPFISNGKLDIGVCLNNLEESSRWYPGAGIYRPVKLILTQKARIDDWSVFVKTVSIDSQGALVNVSFCAKDAVKGMKVAVYLKDPQGNFVGRKNIDMPADGKVSTDFRVNNPMLWSPKSPTLYRAGISIAAMETQDDTGAGPGRGRMPGLRPLDNKEWKFGIRTVCVSKEHGFQLNGITRKLKGVCLH
ncbi:MAG: beta-galactosidase, partial [Prevotella sp.]|nr:beta-galactosidase [Prevotella sp.]